MLSTGLVPRLAVTTAKGELVAEHLVTPEKVLPLLQQWFKLLTTDLIVCVDDAVVSEHDRARILGMDLQPKKESLPTPEMVGAYADTIHRAFEQVREAEWEATKRVQTLTAGFADELARQRQLMHVCIRDVDAVDRAIVATNQIDRMSARINAAAHQTAGRPETGINFGDLLTGVGKALNRQFGGRDDK